ncbi:endolytic transglycosylase MltG [Nicoliella spurrieriana]|uniref:Endolytic murein transglycosylase n=1 Tax=Nicoliella spurrieriana TaxID=2925830 RepID=A0A976X5B4_9LACO|nr:endolytic transglycosylase MltG [Nicoliella spurrieriana]UQS86685.1 endolytic transglycosylase MltG [Nicoliella spurrieriana]
MSEHQSDSNQDSQAPAKFGRKIILWIASILIILFISIVFLGHNYVKTSLKPLNPSDHQTTEVNIPMGASDKKIGSILQDQGIVKSGIVFNYYVKAHNITNFRSGYYEFAPSMGLNQIAKLLQKGGAAESLRALRGRVVVREGANISAVADMVAQRTNYSRQEFLALMNDQKFIDQLAKQYPELLKSATKAKDVRYRLEGYLFPATYSANGTKNLKQLVEQMVAKTNTELKPYYRQIKKNKLTVQQVLTVASLVQGENVNAKNGAIIAGVLYNKLNAGLTLDATAAVAYASNNYLQKLTKQDYRVKSAYNLAIHHGYGPGPVNNPSLTFIQAALNPKERSKGYLYYLNDTSNKRVFYSQDQISSLKSISKGTTKQAD